MVGTLGVVPPDRRLDAEAAAGSLDHRRDEGLAAALNGAREMWEIVVIGTPPGARRPEHGGASRRRCRGDPGCSGLPRDAPLQGTIESIRSVERETGRRYAPLVVLPTFADARRSGAVAAVTVMRERFGEMVSPRQIPRSARYDSAALAGVPVVVGAPRSTAAMAYRAACDDLVAQLGRKAAKRHGALKRFVRADMRQELLMRRRPRPENGPPDRRRT
jgi:hypothetical protein